MTEYAKMLAGHMYDPLDEKLLQLRKEARQLCHQFNHSNPSNGLERKHMLSKLLGSHGHKPFVEPPIHFDYGSNIHVGDDFYMNFNCCILDSAEVIIGSRVMFAPYVQIYTATHPLSATARSSGKEFAKSITIGDDVWIGGGAIICPGVTLGDRCVVAAGAVVTKDVPADVVIGGNPARIIRPIDNSKE